jgi:hypothetical protein
MRHVTENLAKGSKTDISNSVVFHNTPGVEFDFAAISVTVCDGRGVAKMSVGEGVQISTLILQHSL